MSCKGVKKQEVRGPGARQTLGDFRVTRYATNSEAVRMRAREPFTLLKRKRKNLSVWMYRTYDEDGRRLEYSTGLDARTVSKTKGISVAWRAPFTSLRSDEAT